MFVSLEEKHGHLFWCTNHGYYGFLRVAAESVVQSALGLLSPNPLPVEMNKFVSCLFLIFANNIQKLAGPVARARCHPRFAGVFAFGGKDVDLQIWEPVSSGPDSLQEQKLSWRAKNLKNDEYGLRQAIWISDLHFLDEERRALGSGYKVVVCTRFHQVPKPNSN
jgi:hypothetical protein